MNSCKKLAAYRSLCGRWKKRLDDKIAGWDSTAVKPGPRPTALDCAPDAKELDKCNLDASLQIWAEKIRKEVVGE
jgi:hypothetical protein